ncbi:MAG: hypothetical protein LUC16_03305, partial [Coprobacillus sp.]|nr:hypothetical protein [Coprobacillus sp.]
FDICTLGDDGVYTLTIASIEVGSYEYKGVTVAKGETPASDWSNVEEVITGTSGATGNAELVVSASEGDNYTHKITVSITGGVVAEPFEPENYKFSYLITIIVDETEGTALEAAPEGAELYVAGDFNISSGTTWADPIKLYDNGDGTYYLGLDFVPTADKSFEILADDTTDSTQDMWGYIIGEHTITSEEVSSEEEHPVVSISITTEYVGWYIDGGVFPPLGENVEFYVLIYDNSTTTGLTGSDSATFTAQVACWSDGTNDSCTATEAQTTTGSKYVFYSEIATAPQNTNTWFSFAIGSSTMSIAASNIPSNESGTPVYVNYGWMDSSWMAGQSWNANDNGEGTWSYLAEGQTIEAFAQAITLS